MFEPVIRFSLAIASPKFCPSLKNPHEKVGIQTTDQPYLQTHFQLYS